MSNTTRPSRQTRKIKQAAGSRHWLGYGLAAAFVIVALAVALISGISARSGRTTETTQMAVASRPTAAVQPSRNLAPPATSTLVPMNPAGQVSTPAPQWEQLAAPLSVSKDGWNLLVLHTNDTWGYLLPCG